jgi:acetoacetate decarboxylase
MITFKTSADILRALVPEPLIVNSDSLITAFVADFKIIKPEEINYFEAGLFIPTSYEGKKGSYVPVLFLNKTLPITIGREIWGYPKFQADKFVLKFEKEVVYASVMKDGTTFIDATLRLSKEVQPPRIIDAADYALKEIPSVVGKGSFDVKQLTSTVVHLTINEHRFGEEATLQLRSTAAVLLEQIPIFEIVGGFYSPNCSLILDYGEVLYDYLA